MNKRLLAGLMLLSFLAPRPARAQDPAPAAGPLSGPQEAFLRSDMRSDANDMKSDNAQIKLERAVLRADYSRYDQALRDSGIDSPQTKAARQTLIEDRTSLFKTLRDRRNDVKGIQEDKQRLAGVDAQELVRLRRHIDQDTISLLIDKAEVKQDRAALKAARRSEFEAIDEYGTGSPQAKAAQERVDYCLVALHEQLRDLHADAKASRKDDKADPNNLLNEPNTPTASK